MKPILFALAATLLYALGAVILETKLSRFNNFTIIICYCSLIAAIAVMGRQVTTDGSATFAFPTGGAFVAVAVLGIVFAAADYFYIGAYTMQGNLYAIVTVSAMFPVFASLMKLAVSRSLPNGWQMAGYAVAFAAILLVIKGNMVAK